MSNQTKSQMSPDKMQLARNLFKQYDKDYSGHLDVNELLLAVNEMLKLTNYKYECTRNEIVALMSIVDSNHDNRLTFKEFMELVDVFVRTKE